MPNSKSQDDDLEFLEQEAQARFTDTLSYCQSLVQLFDQRDKNYFDIVKAFMMDWQDRPSADWIIPTMSPSMFNAAMGAIRLLTAGDPQINVPYSEATEEARRLSSKVEFAAKAMWSGSGRATLRPVHYDLVFSAVLFGEMCGSVTKTADLVKRANSTGLRGSIARMKALERETPYVFQVYNPAECYPAFDKFGLRALLRRTQTSWGEVLDTWGQMAEDSYPGVHTADEVVIVNDYYDWEIRCVWIDFGGYTWSDVGAKQIPIGSGKPVFIGRHGLDFMPVICQIGEGSSLFAKPEEQRLPLLFALLKSGIWKRENLSLTVFFSLVQALGSMPLMLHQTDMKGQPLQIQRLMGSNVVQIGLNEKLGPLSEKVIDPSVTASLQLSEKIVTESTIPKIALGAAPAHALAYSSISLLSQSGRLPLVAPKEMAGQAISNLLITALRWLKKDGDKATLYLKGESRLIEAHEIPDRLVIDVNLEPDLPQDKLQMASVAQLGVASGLFSKRFARENFMNIGQSDQMDEEVFKERRLDAEFQAILMQVQAMAQAKAQAAVQQAMAPPAPPGGGPPPGAPGAGSPTNGQVPPAGPSGAPPSGGEGLPDEVAGLLASRGAGYPPGRVAPGNPMAGPVAPSTGPVRGPGGR